MRLPALALACAAAGCFAPQIGDGTIRCGPGFLCPPGTACAPDSRCHKTVSSGDFGVGDFGGGDRPPQGNCGGPNQPACGQTCAGGGCYEPASGHCVPVGDNGAMSGVVCLAGAFVACGAPGGPCCSSSAPGTCGSGACCFFDQCITGLCSNAAGTCSQGSCAQCGGVGKDCCGGDGTNAAFCTSGGLACVAMNNACEACGGAGQTCCERNRCPNGGCCDGTSHTCVPSGAACGGGAGQCASGGCQGGACGRQGQAPCPGGVGCTESNTVEAGAACVACGGTAQPCCAGVNGRSCGVGLSCSAGSCAACGEVGLSCCPGRSCRVGQCTGAGGGTCK
jgi:hypothetical protein